MTTQNQFLPQYTLDQLSERVCLKLQYFHIFYNSQTMWDGIFELCRKIEEEPRAVSSVIAEAKLQNKLVIKDPLIRQYNLTLTRVYVILYYRHPDDPVYGKIVFPELLQMMGIYAKDDLSKVIVPVIKSILEQDKMLEKVRIEKKKDVKPLFTYVPHSPVECDHLYNEYNEEQLFRDMSGVIKELSDKYDTNLDEADAWYNAKQVVHTLRDVKRPELLIERAVSAFIPGLSFNEYEGAQIIMLCVYMMVRAMKNHHHFDHFILKMESYALDNFTDMTVLQKIRPIKQRMDENGPYDDYDYIGEQTVKTESFTQADLKEALSEYQSKIQQLEEELQKRDGQIESMKAQLKEAETKVVVHQEDEDAEERIINVLSKLLSWLLINDDEEKARSFLKEAKGKDDIGIADIVFGLHNDFKCKTRKIDIWRILDAGGYYLAGETNFSTALRNRGWQ